MQCKQRVGNLLLFNYFTELLLLSNFSSNFVKSIFCKTRSKLENYNLTYITLANFGGKRDTLYSSKNSYFHKLSPI